MTNVSSIANITMATGTTTFCQSFGVTSSEAICLGTKSCPPKMIQQADEWTDPTTTTEVAVGASSSQTAVSGASSSKVKMMLNPQYEAWVVVDRLLLGWLYSSMNLVMGVENAKDLWSAIQELFGVQSRAEEDFLRQTFQQTRKGNMKMVDYLRLMKSHTDNLGYVIH